MSKLYFSTMLHFSQWHLLSCSFLVQEFSMISLENSLLFQLSWGFTSNRWSLIPSSKMTTDFYFYRSFLLYYEQFCFQICKDTDEVKICQMWSTTYFVVHWAGYCMLLKYKPLLLTLIKSNFLCLGCEFY